MISEERTDYAEQLVTLAQRMSATPVQPMLGMANRSDLSTRVTAVLDDRLRRGRAGFALVGRHGGRRGARGGNGGAGARGQRKPDADIVAALEEQQPAPRTAGDRKSRALDRELYEAANEGDYAGVREWSRPARMRTQ